MIGWMDGWIDRQTDGYKDEWWEGGSDGWTEQWFYKRMDSERMERKGDRQVRNVWK